MVNDVLALDMAEDNLNDIDIVVATQLSTITGQIEVWHNQGANDFGDAAASPEHGNPATSPIQAAQHCLWFPPK